MPIAHRKKKPPSLVDAARFFAPFLARSGVPSDCTLRQVTDGPLNRVYGVENGEKKWALKWYGTSQAAFARYFTEWAFYDLTWGHGLRQVPEPCAWDEDRALALLVWCDGQPVPTAAINTAVLAEVLTFMQTVNRLRPFAAGRAYPVATGAVFSLEDRCLEMERLLQRLGRAIPGQTKPARQLRDEVDAAWQLVANMTLARWESAGWKSKRVLPLAERCLAPADFSLANALRDRNGRLMFYDFDGAGWQDPAWVLAGFFAREAQAPPLDLWDSFANNFARLLGFDAALVQRAETLWPVVLFRRRCLDLLAQCQTGKPPAAATLLLNFRQRMAEMTAPHWWRASKQARHLA